MRFGFCGPSSQVQSPLVNAEFTQNWYLEQSESPNARTQWALYRTPGVTRFAQLLPGLPSTRGELITGGRAFAVAGTHLFELTGAGVVTDYGGFGGNNFMVDDGLPVTMVAGGTSGGIYPGQILIASGGTVTVFGLDTNTFKAIAGAPVNVLMVEFLDGFFIALSSGNSWQVSNPEDATTWSGLAVSQVAVFSSQLQALIATNRLLWVFGAQRAVAYYNSGAPLFPFDVVNGGFMEVGILAQYSVARVAAKAGTTVMWLGGDERGANVVFAAVGFVPTRVSDHALEFWMSQQAITSDAVGFATQEQGHNFYWLWFPSANATWRLDVDLGMWHRLSSRVNNVQGAHLGRCHMFAFGQHLIGDRSSGTIYSMSQAQLSENTAPGVYVPILRTRIGPTISEETNWQFINEFLVDFRVGIGPQPPLLDANNRPRDPYAMFSYSGDYGQSWEPEKMIPCGQAGNRILFATDRRVGRYRNWTPKVTVSDPVDWSIADAYVNPRSDHSPRYAKSIARVS